MRISFLIPTLLCFAISPATNAQCPESNQEIFEQQVMKMVNEYKKTYNSFKVIEGSTTENIRNQILIDTTVSAVLRIDAPEIIFSKIDKNNIQRKIESRISIEAGAWMGTEIFHLDTLAKSCLKQVRSTGDNWLKGERSGLFSRVFFPVLLIVAGLVIILGLFYIRS